MPPDDIDVVAEVVERFLDRCHQLRGSRPGASRVMDRYLKPDLFVIRE